MPRPSIDQPLHVEAFEGMVLVNRPDGVAFTMTGEAAVELCDQLSEMGLRAIGQRKQIEWKLGQPGR